MICYGYARVSTKGQGRDGNSLEGQDVKLRENGATVIVSESFTGTKRHRPELDKLFALLQSGDTLVVTKLDRIARSAMHGSALMEDLLAKGIKVNVLNMGMMDNTPASKLMRSMFFAFAEFERDMIVERTTEGKEIAKTKEGFHEGRPEKNLENFRELMQAVEDGCSTVSAACKLLGISRPTWYTRIAKVGE